MELRLFAEEGCSFILCEWAVYSPMLLPSCHTCSHFTPASQVFAFDYDQLNHTQFLSFLHIKENQMFLILSLLR